VAQLELHPAHADEVRALGLVERLGRDVEPRGSVEDRRHVATVVRGGDQHQRLRGGREPAAAGAVYTEGFERAVRATGATAKDIKRSINGELIYPPLDDATEILRRADPYAARRPSAGVAA
jgi:hypothetical protein